MVTFLWPRKEKSLAQARRAGETPSRAEHSRSMRRSRIKGSTAGSGIRSKSARGRVKPRRGRSPRIPWGEAVSRGQPLVQGSGERPSSWKGSLLRCNALRLLHPTVCHCVAKPRHHNQSANVRIGCAIRTYSRTYGFNTPGGLWVPSPWPSPKRRGDKVAGSRKREQPRIEKGAGQAPFDAVMQRLQRYH